MAPRQGSAAMLLALAVSALAHGLALAILPGGPVPGRLALPQPPPRSVTIYRPVPVPHPTADIPAAGATDEPRRIEVRRVRTIHLPPEPAPRRTRPRPTAKPTRPRPPRPGRPGHPPTVETPPLVAALAAADREPVARVAVPGGEIVLALPRPGTTLRELLAQAAGPLVIAACTAGWDPAEVEQAGGEWSAQPVAADDPLWTRPNDVRTWWRTFGQGEALLLRRGATVQALWLPQAVRAGWEARQPEALRLWDNLAANPRWRATAAAPELPWAGGSQ